MDIRPIPRRGVLRGTAALGLLAATGGPVALAACSSSTGTTGAGAGGLAGKKVIYVANQITSYVATSCGAQSAASQDALNYSVHYAEHFAASEQIPLINAAVAAQPDALLVSPVDPKALVIPLKQAAAQGIKVITVGNQLADASFVTSAVIGAGARIGAAAADELNRLAAGRSGQVAYIGFTPGGSSITDAWQAAFFDQIKKYPNLDALPMTVVSGTDPTAGAAAANAVLSAHPDLLGIVGGFNPMANGVAQAVQERGLAGRLILVQLGADPKAVDAVKAGVSQAVIDDRVRDEGTAAIRQTVNALTGKPVTKNVSVGLVTFTKDNAADPTVTPYILSGTC